MWEMMVLTACFFFCSLALEHVETLGGICPSGTRQGGACLASGNVSGMSVISSALEWWWSNAPSTNVMHWAVFAPKIWPVLD